MYNPKVEILKVIRISYHFSNSDDERFVELLIKAGADVNHIDKKGGSVMHWAAHKASDKMANILIKNGLKNASVQDHTGKTPLYYAKLTGT